MHFFFHAEDGIRVGHVTGVQTCALPILPRRARGGGRPRPGGDLMIETLQEWAQIPLFHRWEGGLWQNTVTTLYMTVDRKRTSLNSSYVDISYDVICLNI